MIARGRGIPTNRSFKESIKLAPTFFAVKAKILA
jgi:hypothetical protein